MKNNYVLTFFCLLHLSFLTAQQVSTAGSCFDNGTGNDTTDDVITFTASPASLGCNITGSYFGAVVDAPGSFTVSGDNIFFDNGAGGETQLTLGGSTSGTQTFRIRDGDGTIGEGTKVVRFVNQSFSTNCWVSVSDPGVPCSVPPPCGITFSNLAVSSCNDTDNSYELVVIATYENAPAGDISISVGGGAAMTFTPDGTSPDMFTISGLDSDGAIGVSVEAAFANDATCMASSTYDAPGACFLPPDPPMPCAGNPGDIGGTVFLDINNDGANAGETGQAGMIVMVYDCDGNFVGNTTTGANGEWTVTGLTDGEQYRVEFTFPASLAYLQPSASGTDNGTDVQFVTPATCEVDFGVVNPADYCEANPLIATPCYVNGDITGAAPNEVLVRWPYNASNVVAVFPNQQIGASQNEYIGDKSSMGAGISPEFQHFICGCFLKTACRSWPQWPGSYIQENKC